MANPTYVNGSFYIEDENLTHDIASSLYTMINTELNARALAYTTEVDDYEFTDETDESETALPTMIAQIMGVGRNSYTVNLEYFFEWAAVDFHRDNDGEEYETIKEKYYPLLYLIAKHELELVFSYYDYQYGESYLSNKTVAVSLDKDLFLDQNKVQTTMTILEENDKQATYSDLEAQGFIDPYNYGTKKQLDNGDWEYFFDDKEKYEEWLGDIEEEGWLSDDKSKFADDYNTEYTVDPHSDHFIPLG